MAMGQLERESLDLWESVILSLLSFICAANMVSINEILILMYLKFININDTVHDIDDK